MLNLCITNCQQTMTPHLDDNHHTAMTGWHNMMRAGDGHNAIMNYHHGQQLPWDTTWQCKLQWLSDTNTTTKYKTRATGRETRQAGSGPSCPSSKKVCFLNYVTCILVHTNYPMQICGTPTVARNQSGGLSGHHPHLPSLETSPLCQKYLEPRASWVNLWVL